VYDGRAILVVLVVQCVFLSFPLFFEGSDAFFLYDGRVVQPSLFNSAFFFLHEVPFFFEKVAFFLFSIDGQANLVAQTFCFVVNMLPCCKVFLCFFPPCFWSSFHDFFVFLEMGVSLVQIIQNISEYVAMM